MNMLHVVTPVTRYEYLNAIYNSLKPREGVQWHVIHDCPKDMTLGWSDYQPFEEKWIHESWLPARCWGNPHRNLALESISSGWVTFLDDDNFLSGRFFEVFDTYRDSPYNGLIFTLAHENGTVEAKPSIMQSGMIDLAQYTLRREFIGKARFSERYDADGQFISGLYHHDHMQPDRSRADFLFFNGEPRVTHNFFTARLKWGRT